ncbi:MAG: hypothetical protein QXH34_02935 [Ignisphaera sp.]
MHRLEVELLKKRHLDVSPVPLGSNGAHDPCVEWLVATVNRRAEGTTRPRKTYKNLGWETVLALEDAYLIARYSAKEYEKEDAM